VLGAGWSVNGPGPFAFAIGLIVDVPWHETNRQHKFRLELIDLDGNPVALMGPAGEQPVAIEDGFEVGRPPGLRSGTALTVPYAINFGPMPIPPGGHYEWRLSINGETREDWRLPFGTRPAVELPRAA
jgi:hypothetical protein